MLFFDSQSSLKNPSQKFKPNQIHSTISPTTFTAQYAGIHGNKEVEPLWSLVRFAEYSGTLLKKQTLRCDFFCSAGNTQSNHSFYHSCRYPSAYNILRAGLQNRLLNYKHLITPPCFSNTFKMLLRYQVTTT